MIKTAYGGVPLRRPRDKELIVDSDGTPHEICRNWLATAPDTDTYMRLTKRAMLVASHLLKLTDGSIRKGPAPVDPRMRSQRAPQRPEGQEARERLTKSLAALRGGSAPVPLPPHGSIKATAAHKEQSSRQPERFLCVKKMQRLSRLKWAWAKFDNGWLKLYKYKVRCCDRDPTKATHVYDLRKAKAFYQSESGGRPGALGRVQMKSHEEPFIPDYNHRVVLLTEERPHGPLFLYTDSAEEALILASAVAFSRHLHTPGNWSFMRSALDRATGSFMTRAWPLLFRYAKEIESTRASVRRAARKLMNRQVDKGWSKFRMVYLQRLAEERKREELAARAIRMLEEKLLTLRTGQAKYAPFRERQVIIDRVQRAFRRHKVDKLQDGLYQVPTVVPHLQQALRGIQVYGAFTSLTRKHVLLLLLQGKALEHCTTRQDAMASKEVPAYSAGSIPLGGFKVAVNDSCMQLSFQRLHGAGSSLETSRGWAPFVNVDRISSIVLHTERIVRYDGTELLLDPEGCAGPWITINGPRVCWSRFIRTNKETREHEAVGEHNGLLRVLSGEPLKWVRFDISVKSAEIDVRGQASADQQEDHEVVAMETPRPGVVTPEEGAEMDYVGGLKTLQEVDLEDDKQGSRSRFSCAAPCAPGKRPKQLQTEIIMLLHCFGRQHRSAPLAGGTFSGTFVSELPIANEEDVPAFFERAEVCIDVVERAVDSDYQRTLCHGRFRLNEVFTQPTKEHLAHVTVPMVRPLKGIGQAFLAGESSVELEISCTLQGRPSAVPCVSPELIGRGPLASLFTSQRSAWYDEALGPAQHFDGSKAANFVELLIEDLVFCEAQLEKGRLFRYHVAASLNGVLVQHTVWLHRPNEAWIQIFSVDPDRIDFAGARLFVPLPPGSWASPKEPPCVEVSVWRIASSKDTDASDLSFTELMKGRKGKIPEPPTRVYHACLSLGGMQCDQEFEDVPVPLSKPSEEPPKYRVLDLSSARVSKSAVPAMLRLSAALRDRDYVRLEAGRLSASPQLSHTAVVCVGEKVLIPSEQPIAYPANAAQYRKQLFPGHFSDTLVGTTPWNAPLRNPNSVYERKTSGMVYPEDEMVDLVEEIKPTSTEDVAPHKFTLTGSEVEFIKSRKPGCFWRVVEEVKKSYMEYSEEPEERVIVTNLTHLRKHLPAIVLATYADGTCDVELLPSFVRHWQTEPTKRFSIPGEVKIVEVDEDPGTHIAQLRPDVGDAGPYKTRRVILRGLPLHCVAAVQAAGFNVYDASLSTVDEALERSPRRFCNSFNPRVGNTEDDRGPYAVYAGPLPADVGPECQHEWSLHLNMKSEQDMFHFVTSLRRAAQEVLHQQLKQVGQYERSAVQQSRNIAVGPVARGGHLEVVLMEAKNLRPTKVLPDRDIFTTMQRMSKVDMTVGATFKVMPSQGGDALSYNGQKLQTAPAVAGNSPSWSKMEDFMHSGGWVFKTPDIDPRRMPESYFELEIQNVGISPEVLGVVQVPLTGRSTAPTPWAEQRVNLCDPKSPFHDVWLPLQAATGGDEGAAGKGSSVAPTGLIHVMTLWVPEVQSTQTTRTKAPLMTASRWQAQLLRKRLLEEPLRDPSTGLALQVRGYNPNTIARPGDQVETRFNALARHLASVLHTQVLLNGLEHQESVAWAAFRLRPQSIGWPPTHLADWRQDRQKAGEQQCLVEIDTLLRRGVPSKERWRIWSEVTRADPRRLVDAGSFHFNADAAEVQEGLAQYANLIALGLARSSQVNLQILEDQADVLQWEASPQERSGHWSLVQQAGRLCMALTMLSAPTAATPSGGSVLNFRELRGGARGVAYCQSLLVVAYFLLLALQRVEWPETGEEKAEEKVEQQSALRDVARSRDRSMPHIAPAEARAFWLLYVLAGPPHADYAAYYGMPTEEDPPGSDAMDDVFRLTLILSHEEPALHTHLAALGFHLSIVFYGAFMRLFATFLPTASLFRFWDIVFAELENPMPSAEKPRRHSLIDLAFGALHASKERLLRCQSARDARDCVVDQLESMHDPVALAEIVGDAESRIWQQPLKSALGASHGADYERAKAVWGEHFFKPLRAQTGVIRAMMAEGGAFTWQTKDMTRSLIPKLAKEYDSDGKKYGGLLRQTPQKVLALQDLDGSLSSSLEHSIRSWYNQRFSTGPGVELVAVAVPPPHGSKGEPELVDGLGFAAMLERATEGTAWENSRNSRLAAAFEAPVTQQELRVSPNEVLAALICCSRGTVGEKALALFELYGFRQETRHQVPHSVAASSVTKLVLKNAGARGDAAANTISIQACRLLVQGILARSLHKVTNREAALLADQTFSRASAVPAILDAVLVKGAVPADVKSDIRKYKQRYVGSFTDVRRKLTISHEVQVALWAGRLNLCFVAGATHLRDLRIQDPYASQKKVLWIRFARGGDGERQNAFVAVDERGFLSEAEVRFDMDHTSEVGNVQMTISREEFLNCFLASPLLSETLRRLSSSEPGSLAAGPQQQRQQQQQPGQGPMAAVRELLRQQQKLKLRPVEALNEARECFGYALYTHMEDAESTEWRKAIIQRADPQALTHAGRFKASLIHSTGGEAALAKLASLSADAVLLAPAAPRILESGCKEHEEFLAKVPGLHEAGFSAEEIQGKLNEELTVRWKQSKPTPDGHGGLQVELPLITLVDVQHALRRGEAPGLMRENSRASTRAEG